MDLATGLSRGACQEVLKRLDCVSIDGGEGSGVGSAVLAGVRCASPAWQGGGSMQQKMGRWPFQ